MDTFKQSVIDETEQVYLSMYQGQTEAPYGIYPKVINSSDTYSKKLNGFRERLKTEWNKFNNSLSSIKGKRKARLKREEEARKKRAENRKRTMTFIWQLIITLLCLAPIAYLDYSGIGILYDEFTNSNKFIEFTTSIGIPVPEFIENILCVPLWIGLAYFGVATLVKKIGKSTSCGKGYIYTRYVLMVILSVVEAIISFIVLST